MTTGIYKITERETGRCYVGQSKCIERRWKEHHGKYPVSAFDYEIVVQCFDEPESLDFWERRCIVDYNAHVSQGGFNHTWGGNGAWGSKTPEETRRKKSEALTGKPRSEEHNQNVIKALTGKPLSEKHRQSVSKGMKGKSPYNKGKKTGPKPKSQCPYCGIWCAPSPMAQFHGDNCKKKEVSNSNL